MRRNGTTAIAALLLSALWQATAWASDPAAIDAALDAALARGLSTADQVSAIDEAAAQWDALLNTRYGELRAVLPAEAWAALQQAQRRWIGFRDAEYEALAALYDDLEGTMFLPMHAAARLDIVKRRALELDDYLTVVGLDAE